MDRYLPKPPLKDRLRELARDARDSHALTEQGEHAAGSGDPVPIAVPGWYLVADPLGPFPAIARVIDWSRHYVDAVRIRDGDPAPIFPGFDPLEPVIQNVGSTNFELVFGERSAFGGGILIGVNRQWTPRAISDIDPLLGIIATVRTTAGSVTDITDRTTRVLGHVVSDGPGLPDDVGNDLVVRAPYWDGGLGGAAGIIGAFTRVTIFALAPMLVFRADPNGDSSTYLFDGSAPLELTPAPGSGRTIRSVTAAAPDWRGTGTPVRFRREL